MTTSLSAFDIRGPTRGLTAFTHFAWLTSEAPLRSPSMAKLKYPSQNLNVHGKFTDTRITKVTVMCDFENFVTFDLFTHWWPIISVIWTTHFTFKNDSQNFAAINLVNFVNLPGQFAWRLRSQPSRFVAPLVDSLRSPTSRDHSPLRLRSDRHRWRN